ncbi:MAG: NAD(P)H-dependent oxidoreductase [Pseudomonadota bacterium]
MTQLEQPKRIFVLNGHPAERSLSKHLAETYAKAAAEREYEVRVMNIRDIEFDSDFGFGGYRQTKPLEPDLETLLANLEWSRHLVLVTPMWWGGVPAKLKGLFDRVLLPGRTFDTRKKKGGFPTPMLSGRTARVILTSDTFDWYFKWVYRRALWIQLKHQILGFVGFKPAMLTHFATASHPKDGLVEQWAEQVRSLGYKGR